MRAVAGARASVRQVLFLAIALASASAAFGASPARCATDGQARDSSNVRLVRPPEGSGSGHHYALIVNGDAGPHHVRNCLDAYAALRANGFADDQIFLLSNEPPVGTPQVPPLGPNDGPPSPRNLTTVFNYLKAEVGSEDTLVVYVTGHGGGSGRDADSFVELVPRSKARPAVKQATLSLPDFVAKLACVHPRRGLLLFDQCYGEAFANAAAATGPFVAIALSTKAEEVYCQNFSPVFWGELRKAGLQRKRLARWTLKAAYERAAKVARKREKTQRPILKSGPGCDASKFFLWE